jgi:hypothetical protein
VTWGSLRARLAAATDCILATQPVTTIGHRARAKIDIHVSAVLHAVTGNTAITPTLWGHGFASDPQVLRNDENGNLVLVCG